MSTPWFSTAPAPEPKGLFRAGNLQAAAASIALPGIGHQMQDRFTVGIAWAIFSLAFYGALIIFRVAADARLYLLTGIVALLMSCAAVYDCCLRGKPYAAIRKLGFFLLAVLVSAVWALGVCQGAAMLAGFRHMRVLNKSMSPTIPMNASMLVDLRYYEHHKPQDGEIVMVHQNTPYSPSGILRMSRIEGVGGETVQIRDGKLVRNGVPVDEPYAFFDPSYPAPAVWLNEMHARTIPAGELFLLGDNRNNSYDSRASDLGNFHESDLRGKVVRLAKWF